VIGKSRDWFLLLAAGFLVVQPGRADTVFFHGKVVLEDGSPPGRMVSIQRVCTGMDPIRETSASGKTGQYSLPLEVSELGGVFSGNAYSLGTIPCVLEATLDGFSSSRLDISDPRLTINPQLPNIVLTRIMRGAAIDLNRGNIPRAASRPWAQALKLILAADFAAAEVPLRAVVRAAPKFAAGWAALGLCEQRLHKPAEARPALERSRDLDPKVLPTVYMLASADFDLKDWEAASATSQSLIQADTRHIYLEAYIIDAISRYELKDLDGSIDRISELIRLDKRQELPRAEYILGTMLEARREYDAAAAHMRAYLDKHPRAKDAAAVVDRIANLGKANTPADLTGELQGADLHAPLAAEAAVPGGLKAFAAIARIPAPVSRNDFFLEYCRSITENDRHRSSQTLESGAAVSAFIAAVAELEQLGTREPDHVAIRLAVDTEEHRRHTDRVLALFGWKLAPKGDGVTMEPGDKTIDGLRQPIPAALGIDELTLRAALEANRPLEFEVPVESAPLIGGSAWGVVLKGVPEAANGPIEIFLHDWRFARVYAALGDMEPNAAGAVVSGIGLANLLVKYSFLLADEGHAITVTGKSIILPGGAKANAVWAHLSGANPQNPTLFLRALFEKDGGHLLAFYHDLALADATHQQFFLASAERAGAFYKWYRESLPAKHPEDRWQATILQRLGLDSASEVRFPGGRQAWTTARNDEDALLHLLSMRTLAAAIELEQRRGEPLDADSVALLTLHYTEWKYLFPYFEKLPGLGAAEFQALADFADEAGSAPARRQALLLSLWHSLVEIDVLASQSGSLDKAAAAKAFRNICQSLRTGGVSAQAIDALRQMAGGAADLDEALPANLLRLNGASRDAYESVKTLQSVPAIRALGDSPDPAKTQSALSGVVYAALLDPRDLLVAEDSRLLAKHNFLPGGEKRSAMFADSALVVSNSPPGSNLAGGFARLAEVAQEIHARRVKVNLVDAPAPAAAPEEAVSHAPSPVEPGPRPPAEAVFRASGRIVEVYATVTDSRGRYVDDLTADQFTILEGGQAKPVFAFENHTAGVSVALLFDATGSMDATLPSLKSAALQLIDDLRAEDSVAVYCFNSQVTELQPYTTDKDFAKRAVLRTHAAGTTALYDALLRVNHDMAGRAGKKVILVFTDGDDNASRLTSDDAILRAKGRGIPIYTIAEGEALVHRDLIEQLTNMSRSTGGTAFLIRKLSDISPIFQKVAEELMHGYLLAFQPSEGEDHSWRKIEVVLANGKGRTVRAREGYFPE